MEHSADSLVAEVEDVEQCDMFIEVVRNVE